MKHLIRELSRHDLTQKTYPPEPKMVNTQEWDNKLDVLTIVIVKIPGLSTEDVKDEVKQA